MVDEVQLAPRAAPRLGSTKEQMMAPLKGIRLHSYLSNPEIPFGT